MNFQRKVFIYLLFLICINNVYSQNLIVSYETNVTDITDKSFVYLFTNNTLITNQNESLYISTNRDTIISYEGGEFFSESNPEFSTVESRKDVSFKNLEERVYFNKDVSLGKVIRDDMYKILDWKITDKTKIILGKLCQEGTCTFRGRNYSAYFSTELPYSNGPFKFDGLPGLILEVVSSDRTVRIIAKKIEITQEKIINPFIKEKKFVSWTEYIKWLNVTIDKINVYSKTQGVEANIPKKQIEYFNE